MYKRQVLAIIITIMVLELKVPEGGTIEVRLKLWPKFLSYLLSFIYVGIYWNNHHHLFQVTEEISGGVLWANLHLLFWLSLVPFVTGWMGENHFNSITVALYGLVLLLAAVAYSILLSTLLRRKHNKKLAAAIGKDIKGKISIICYVLGMVAAFFWPVISLGIYALVALMWLVPDSRIENKIATPDSP